MSLWCTYPIRDITAMIQMGPTGNDDARHEPVKATVKNIDSVVTRRNVASAICEWRAVFSATIKKKKNQKNTPDTRYRRVAKKISREPIPSRRTDDLRAARVSERRRHGVSRRRRRRGLTDSETRRADTFARAGRRGAQSGQHEITYPSCEQDAMSVRYILSSTDGFPDKRSTTFTLVENESAADGIGCLHARAHSTTRCTRRRWSYRKTSVPLSIPTTMIYVVCDYDETFGRVRSTAFGNSSILRSVFRCGQHDTPRENDTCLYIVVQTHHHACTKPSIGNCVYSIILWRCQLFRAQ